MDAKVRTKLCEDLAAEGEALLGLIDGLHASDWWSATPAAGWSVADQVRHLARFNERASEALVDPSSFRAGCVAALAISADVAELELAGDRVRQPEELRDWFAMSHAKLLISLEEADWSVRVPWYGPAMSVASCATARLMEIWAHGQDIADALGQPRTPTDRLVHVARLGIRTRSYSYSNRGLVPPDIEIRVALTGPTGDTYVLDDAGEECVSGLLVDFCLVVTRRRHLLDTGLRCQGDAALEWMNIAQAFAGGAGSGRAPTPAYVQRSAP
jgi:uncharacterized protein (TIGR03084 family)